VHRGIRDHPGRSHRVPYMLGQIHFAATHFQVLPSFP
jgi:hypothetical protein